MRLLFVALGCISCINGATLSRISGLVTDQSRSAVPEAMVVISDNAHTPIYLTTDLTGQFSSAPLAPGTYVIDISKSGFEPQQRSIMISNQDRVLNIALPLASQSYSVTVESSPSHLDAASDAHRDAFTLDQHVFSSLPIKDGNILNALGSFVNPAGGCVCNCCCRWHGAR